MKISVACLCLFSFCTLYWALGTSLGLAHAEDAVVAPSASASLDPLENETVSAVSDSESGPSEPNVNSDSKLEPSADIHSSIDELLHEENELHPNPDYAFLETLSQNSGVAHEVVGSTPGIIHTVDSARLELQEKAEELTSSSANPSHNETPAFEESNLKRKSIAVEPEPPKENVSVEVQLEARSDVRDKNTTETEQVPSPEPKSNATEQADSQKEPPEEIPSFSEWAQKQLEEAEKKEQANSSQSQQNGKSGSKKRWKNYASPDCGAKIIAANPEAVSAGSVLSSSRDEYKLNTCTSRIWFIVELCEAIQAKKIDLANFELFSSSPKDFSIFVSDRFPTRDWSSVGHFTAKDERDVQSFDLHPHLFGKYIKFEMHSHHGFEHYCPISLFRVYGTSEFEVLETENQPQHPAEDDDDDEPLDLDEGGPTTNLFSSATDAVISIVKKAAEVLGNKGNGSSSVKDQQNDTVKYTPLISTCTTPSHIVVCDNCSDLLFGKVFELLSCQSKQLSQLLSNPFIKDTLYHSDVCSKFGLEFHSKTTIAYFDTRKSYITSFFSQTYLAALCNTIAVYECKVVLNISSSNATLTPQEELNTKLPEPVVSKPDINVSITKTLDTSIAESESEISYTSQIKPTKTLSPDELNLTEAAPSESLPEPTVHPTSVPSPNVQNETAEEKSTQHVEPVDVSSEIVGDMETATESSEGLQLDENLDALATDLNGDGSSSIVASTTNPPASQGQKESVFLRLSNRIKVLERNMSLSSQYLEELSRRYKKQVEELQRILDRTITTLNEENKKQAERTQRLENQIASLHEIVGNLIDEKNSWMHTTYWLFLCGVFLLGTLLFCRRNADVKQPGVSDGTKSNEIQRRKSVDVISHKTPVKKKRRPSEEALMIGSSYTHLMIDEVDSSQRKEKKRKKKKNSLSKSNSITTLDEEADDLNKTTNLDKGFYFTPRNASSQIWRRQESAPAASNCVDDHFKRIHDIPFVLEESEHSSLEPLNFISTFEQKNVKVNGNAVHPPFTITASDSRARRMFGKKNGKLGHKKSASFDESRSPTAPSSIATDTTSLTNSIEDPQLTEAPREKKRSVFKKIFKFNFK